MWRRKFDSYQMFRRNLLPLSCALQIEAGGSCEAFIPVYWTTQQHIPEYRILYDDDRENIKYEIHTFIILSVKGEGKAIPVTDRGGP
jgi:hypothetical protein